jgi:HNH endonuclease
MKMELSMECIICRVEKSDMSDEHVIPESLGGYYHIYNVCVFCNSKLGNMVDSPLVNHKLTELYRFCEGLEGKSGKVPNPFSGVFTSKADSSLKAQAIPDEDGMIRMIIFPKIEVNEVAGAVESIRITVDSLDEGKIEKILENKLIRLGIDPADMVRGERYQALVDGEFSGHWQVDIRRFKIGMLKIAYEFAVDAVSNFYESDDAKEISRILREADHDSVENYVKIGSGLQPEVFSPFIDYLDLESWKHYLVLIQTEMGLVCCIKLHKLFCIGVVLSDKIFMKTKDAIFGINDIKERNFKKLSLEELMAKCLGPIHTRIGYHFDTDNEAYIAGLEINSPSYRYEGNSKAEIPVYKENGERHPFFLHDLLDRSACFSNKEEGWITHCCEFDLSKKYFIRSVESGNLYRVSAFELSQKLIRKI